MSESCICASLLTPWRAHTYTLTRALTWAAHTRRSEVFCQPHRKRCASRAHANRERFARARTLSRGPGENAMYAPIFVCECVFFCCWLVGWLFFSAHSSEYLRVLFVSARCGGGHSAANDDYCIGPLDTTASAQTLMLSTDHSMHTFCAVWMV